MRYRLPFWALVAASGGVVSLSAGEPLEVSTGFLIGPRYDSRLFYVKPAKNSIWQKSYTEGPYRKQAQGRLLGVTLGGFEEPIPPLKAQGFNFARIELQNRQWSLFRPDGHLDAAVLPRFARLLRETAEAGFAVELVLFHPECDQKFDSPDTILESVRRLTDWLIDGDYRHVLLNPASDWSAPGWDFDHFVPQNLERIALAIRERYQVRRTDYALPIVLSAPLSAEVSPRFVEQADVLVASGEALRMNPLRVERPVLIEQKDPGNCAALFERFAGCIVSAPTRGGSLSPLSPLVLKSVKPQPQGAP